MLRSEMVISWRRMREGVVGGRLRMSEWRWDRAASMRAAGRGVWKSMFQVRSLMDGRVVSVVVGEDSCGSQSRFPKAWKRCGLGSKKLAAFIFGRL